MAERSTSHIDYVINQQLSLFGQSTDDRSMLIQKRHASGVFKVLNYMSDLFDDLAAPRLHTIGNYSHCCIDRALLKAVNLLHPDYIIPDLRQKYNLKPLWLIPLPLYRHRALFINSEHNDYALILINEYDVLLSELLGRHLLPQFSHHIRYFTNDPIWESVDISDNEGLPSREKIDLYINNYINFFKTNERRQHLAQYNDSIVDLFFGFYFHIRKLFNYRRRRDGVFDDFFQQFCERTAERIFIESDEVIPYLAEFIIGYLSQPIGHELSHVMMPHLKEEVERTTFGRLFLFDRQKIKVNERALIELEADSGSAFYSTKCEDRHASVAGIASSLGFQGALATRRFIDDFIFYLDFGSTITLEERSSLYGMFHYSTDVTSKLLGDYPTIHEHADVALNSRLKLVLAKILQDRLFLITHMNFSIFWSQFSVFLFRNPSFTNSLIAPAYDRHPLLTPSTQTDRVKRYRALPASERMIFDQSVSRSEGSPVGWFSPSMTWSFPHLSVAGQGLFDNGS